MPAPATTYRSFIDQIMDRAADDPGAELISDRYRRLTAGQFHDLVAGLARALQAQGLGRGDRVAILATISAEALAVRYAAGLLGCATVFCPNTGDEHRLVNFVTHLRAQALVVFAETAAAARAVIDGALVRATYSIGPVPGVDVDLLQLASALPPQAIPAAAHPDDLAVLISSGGTTGESKASRRSFESYARALNAPPMPNRRLLVCTAFAYIAQILMDQTLLGGGTVVLRDAFDPADVLQAIEAERITHLCLVEPLLVELIDHPAFPEHDLSSLVAISHIGAAAPARLRTRLLHRAGPVFAHPYGASEAGVISALTRPDYDLTHPELLASAGPLVPGVEIRIIGADGEQLPAGEEGLISVRTPGLADGYWDRPSQPAFEEGWYRTGDLGILDVAGYLRIHGRRKDARQVNGRTILPVDVADALCAHPDVRYAVGLALAEPVEAGPDGAFGAMVVLAPGAQITVEELRSFVASHQGPDVVPALIVFGERVPVTEQGKPNRGAITALLTESRPRSRTPDQVR